MCKNTKENGVDEMKSFKNLPQDVQKKSWDDARKNTTYNKDGLAIISKDDEDFDDDWGEL